MVKKNLCAAKGAIRKWNGNPQHWKKYLQIMYQIRDLYPEYINNKQNSIIKKTTQLQTGNTFQ